MMPTFSKKRQKTLLILGILLAIILGVYLLFGYATIVLPKASATGLYINDEYVGDNLSSVRVRPGTYTIKLTSPEHTTSRLTISTLPFTKKTVSWPSAPTSLTTAARDASGLGNNGGYFQFSYGRLFNDVWSAGIVRIPSESYYYVMKFEHGRWDQVYQGDGSDSDFSITVPVEIQTYLKSLPNSGVGVSNGN